MDDRINFIVDCIEEYKNSKEMDGKTVIELFNKYRVIDYIRNHYEALHTTGRNYIVDDITMYIESRQTAMSGNDSDGTDSFTAEQIPPYFYRQ